MHAATKSAAEAGVAAPAPWILASSGAWRRSVALRSGDAPADGLQAVFEISAKFRGIRWFCPPWKFENFKNNNLNIFKSIFKNNLKWISAEISRNFTKFADFGHVRNFLSNEIENPGADLSRWKPRLGCGHTMAASLDMYYSPWRHCGGRIIALGVHAVQS